MHQHRPGFWSLQGYLLRTGGHEEKLREKDQREWGYLLECKECGAPLTLTKKEIKRYSISCHVVFWIPYLCLVFPFRFIPVLRDFATNNIWILILLIIITNILGFSAMYFFFKRIHFEEISPPEEVADLKEA